jgi:hypothetical protein
MGNVNNCLIVLIEYQLILSQLIPQLHNTFAHNLTTMRLLVMQSRHARQPALDTISVMGHSTLSNVKDLPQNPAQPIQARKQPSSLF